VIEMNDSATAVMWDDVVIGEVVPRGFYSRIGHHRDSIAFVVDPAEIEALWIAPFRRCVEPALISEWEQIQAAQQRAALEQFAQTIHNVQITQRRQAIDARQRSIIGYADLIRRERVALREDQRMLDALMHLAATDAAGEMMREWDLLQSHPRVQSMRFADNTIVITTTDDLRLYHPETGESRWLGAFDISIKLDEAYATQLRNLSTPRSGRDHPHVIDGRPCFGGNEEAFAELLADGQLYTYFDLMVQYLETLNLRDEYGRYGAYWFDVEDERPLETHDTELVAA
jgi:hypothetical protein